MLKIREVKTNIKPKIGFKGQLTTKNILDDLDFALENGFDCLEIGLRSEEDFNLNPKIIKKVRDISERNNIFLIVHPSPFLPLSSPFSEISKAVIKVAKKGIIFASKINARYLVLHSGHKESSGPAITKNYDTLIRNLKEIVKFGKRHGIGIALENSTRYSNSVCIEPKDLLSVVNSVSGCKVLLDVGHANTTKIGPVRYFKKIKNFITIIHIHDNDGKSDQHALIGKGNINFKRFLKECKNSNYYGPFILELFPRKNVLKGKEIFLNLWN